jgi:hypothetical protein
VRHEIRYRDEQGEHTVVIEHEVPMDKLSARVKFEQSVTGRKSMVLSVKAV